MIVILHESLLLTIGTFYQPLAIHYCYEYLTNPKIANLDQPGSLSTRSFTQAQEDHRRRRRLEYRKTRQAGDTIRDLWD